MQILLTGIPCRTSKYITGFILLYYAIIQNRQSILSEGRETVKVCIEKPVDYGFKSATCWLPDYRWEKIEGYTQEEIAGLQELVQSLSATIYELAREGASSMPQLFRIGSYVTYFWINENDPVF